MFKSKLMLLFLCNMAYSSAQAKDVNFSGSDLTTAKSFTKVDELETKNLYADLVIKIHDKKEISVQAAGTKKGLESLEIYKDGDELVVKSKYIPKMIYLTLGNIKIMSLDTFKPEDKPTVTVLVPMKTKLDLDMLGDSSVDMASTNGELELKAAGAVKVTGGEYKEAEIDMSGAGTVVLKKISEKFKGTISGTGSIQVTSTKKAKIELSGAGKANFSNIAEGFDAKTSGNGQITAASVNDEIEAEISGTGSINIKAGDVKKLDLEISGAGKFDFGGVAKDAEVKASGASKVSLNKVTGKLKQETSGVAKIQVNQDAN
jgi:putative autotransporter adhesin-like protein